MGETECRRFSLHVSPGSGPACEGSALPRGSTEMERSVQSWSYTVGGSVVCTNADPFQRGKRRRAGRRAPAYSRLVVIRTCRRFNEIVLSLIHCREVVRLNFGVKALNSFNKRLLQHDFLSSGSFGSRSLIQKPVKPSDNAISKLCFTLTGDHRNR